MRKLSKVSRALTANCENFSNSKRTARETRKLNNAVTLTRFRSFSRMNGLKMANSMLNKYELFTTCTDFKRSDRASCRQRICAYAIRTGWRQMCRRQRKGEMMKTKSLIGSSHVCPIANERERTESRFLPARNKHETDRPAEVMEKSKTGRQRCRQRMERAEGKKPSPACVRIVCVN